MPSPKYPLKPLLEHRDRKVDEATAELGDAVRQREAAADAKVRAEQARKQAEEQAAAVRAAEAKRLEGGELRAVDLARAEAWAHAASNEIAQLGRAVDRADNSLTEARNVEGQARGQLAQRMADRDVVAKDRERFVDRARRAQDAAAEEAAEEAWGGGRTGRGERG